MRVKYQIVVEVTADGMMGPLKVQTMIDHALRLHRIINEASLEIGKVRVAAVYPLAPDDLTLGKPFPGVERVPGTDQSRPVEEIKDPRVT
jgi:hypothetical protein